MGRRKSEGFFSANVMMSYDMLALALLLDDYFAHLFGTLAYTFHLQYNCRSLFPRTCRGLNSRCHSLIGHKELPCIVMNPIIGVPYISSMDDY